MFGILQPLKQDGFSYADDDPFRQHPLYADLVVVTVSGTDSIGGNENGSAQLHQIQGGLQHTNMRFHPRENNLFPLE